MTTRNAQGFQTPRHAESKPSIVLGSSTLGMGAFSNSCSRVQMFLVVWAEGEGKGEGNGGDYATFPPVGPLTQWERLRWKRGTSLEVEEEESDRMRTKIEQTHVVDLCWIFFQLYSIPLWNASSLKHLKNTVPTANLLCVGLFFCFVFVFFAGHLEQDHYDSLWIDALPKIPFSTLLLVLFCCQYASYRMSGLMRAVHTWSGNNCNSAKKNLMTAVQILLQLPPTSFSDQLWSFFHFSK